MKDLLIQPNTTVLVLNSSFEPLNITSWKRAIVLLLKEKAQVLSNRVIRLLNYVRVPLSKIVANKPSRAMIYKRDNYTCQYCGATKHLTIDHVVPKSKGGGEDWSNLAVACSKCNTSKGNKLLEQTGMKLARKPMPPYNKMQFTLNNCNIPEWQEYNFQTVH
jgi:5-methylcytosine-specific restriction endonuclease McrA